MAQAVKALGASVLAVVALCGGAAPARAQALEDPTRPPASVTAGVAGVVAVPAVPAAPHLQSVLIGRQAGGRHVAVIDGQTVRLGEHFRGALLVRMTETEVELVRGRQHQVLKLFPSAASRAAAPTVRR